MRLEPLSGDGAAQTAIAGTDETNRLFYAAEFNGRVAPGRWRVGVAVTGERGAGDEVTFEVDIEPARGFNWLWLGAGGLLLAVGLWLATTMRAGSAKRPTAPPIVARR